MSKKLLFILFLFSFLIMYGQKKKIPLIIIQDNKSDKIYYYNQIEKNKLLSNIYYQGLRKGHFFIEIDSLNKDSIGIINGPIYKSIILSDNFQEKKIKLNEFSDWMKSKIEKDANSGFPFSNAHLKFIQFKNDKSIQASLEYNKGVFVKINKIHIKGDLIRSTLISDIIAIHEGSPYHERKINDIDKELGNCQFLTLIKPSEIIFTQNGAEIFCYVKTKKSSSINGVLGVQPNSAQQRIGLTGEFNLNLLNSFKYGEQIRLDWKSILPQTSSLNGKINLPFLFKSPFGIDGNLSLYRRDSTFFEITSKIDVQYSINRRFIVAGSFESYTNNKFENSNTDFLNNANIRGNFFGLNVQFSTLDFPLNPTKGVMINTQLLGGIRTVENEISSRDNVFKSNLKFQKYIRLSKRHVIKFQSSHRAYIADSLFTNERFRIGGLNSIRGFNEETLFSNLFIINSLEYRYRLDNNSYAFTFFDNGMIWDQTTQDNFDSTLSFGLGFAYNTSVGFFNIVGAYGKINNQTLNIGEAKIHFGYVAFF